MTELELKTILKLIDLHTRTKDSLYGKDYLVINESGITALKKDITELFKNENGNKTEI